MAVPTNLAAIRTKTRRIIAQNSPLQISDAELDNYINTFYTSPNVDTYDFPRNTYAFVQPPMYIAGYQAFYSQSREQFYRSFPKINYFQQIGTGTGGVGPFSFQTTAFPFLRGHFNENGSLESDFLLSAVDAIGNAINLIDDSIGGLVVADTLLAVPGAINYVTGAITGVVFPVAPAVGTNINAQYVPYVAARPLACLFFQDQFILRPVPDTSYQVQVDAWRVPVQFDGANPLANPQVNEWWQLIAYGAADKFFADNADFENLQKFRFLLNEQIKLVNRRTIKQQTNQRSSTIYSDSIQFPYNNQAYRSF